jgi:hypothetical protein
VHCSLTATDTLVGTSPYCARVTREEPDIPIDVPEHFTARTVNIFTQLVSPTRATSLPTHYLWTSGKPVPGVYDRFGAIRPEEIPWTIGTLLGLHAFAQLMQVHFVCDMVLDRIHWMFTAQVKMKKEYASTPLQHKSLNEAGKNVLAGFRRPKGPDLDCSLAAEDFETEHLEMLALEEPLDFQALTFIADVIHALGGAPDQEWWEAAPEKVKGICATWKRYPQRFSSALSRPLSPPRV